MKKSNLAELLDIMLEMVSYIGEYVETEWVRQTEKRLQDIYRDEIKE